MSLYVDIKKQLGSFCLSVKFQTNGGIQSILGASGCGKSLTLKCIAGIERPDEGKILLDDTVLFDSSRKINLPPQKRHVGYLFQNYALFPNMTVRQNILCGLKQVRDKSLKAEKLNQLLSLFQLEDLQDHYPYQLSGGQAQRCALARILASEPKLLLLDEPFSALDAHLRDRLKIEIRDLLRSINKDVIMVTHSRDEAYNMSETIAVMHEGTLLLQKKTKDLFADPEYIPAAVLTGCKNIVPAEKSGEYEVFVPSWNIHLKTAKPVRDSIKAIGIRAHYFNPDTPHNRFPVSYIEEMEEPFEWIIQFQFAGADPDSEAVWWRLPKSKRPKDFPEMLGIAPANILQLS